jgi:hypothetical protein
MKKILTFLISALNLCLWSCGDDDEIGCEFYPIEVTTEGINLTFNEREAYATIPADGAEFTLLIGDVASLSWMSVDDKYVGKIQTTGASAYATDEEKSVVGDWGSLKYESLVENSVVHTKILPNELNRERKFLFRFTYVREDHVYSSNIRVTQLAE